MKFEALLYLLKDSAVKNGSFSSLVLHFDPSWLQEQYLLVLLPPPASRPLASLPTILNGELSFKSKRVTQTW